MNKPNKTIYMIAIIVWLTIVSWQVIEHRWIRISAQEALKNRAEDISNSLAVILRSQRRFGGGIFQYRLESALNELVQSEELNSIFLLNSSSKIVAKSGQQSVPINNTLKERGEYWTLDSVAFMNLVDLNVFSNDDENQFEEPAVVVIPITEEEAEEFRERRRPPRPDERDDTEGSTTGEFDRNNDNDGDRSRNGSNWRDGDNRRDGGNRGDGGRRRRFPFPPPEEFEAFLEQQGLHGFIIELSSMNYIQTCNRDLWLRFFIIGFASIALAGSFLAWRNVKKSAELQMRLVRASEMNTHLREMNVAAAGLAHETRNPLNLVRGMAQLIYKDNNTSTGVREHSMKITEEVDRVTAQLNEFINYSKPREPKLSALNINRVFREVAQTLETDMADKEIQFSLQGEDVFTEADESLLRQMVFNLILNSVQSVSEQGKIAIKINSTSKNNVVIEFMDDGSGISEENINKIFQPYFTTNEKGTGLGLTVVQQIVLAHGWEIKCLRSKAGALFQISGILQVNPVQ